MDFIYDLSHGEVIILAVGMAVAAWAVFGVFTFALAFWLTREEEPQAVTAAAPVPAAATVTVNAERPRTAADTSPAIAH